MPKRQSHGSGSLNERSDRPGTWTYRVRLGVGPGTGKSRRKVWTIKAANQEKTSKAAKELLAQFEAAPQPGPSMTVAALLEEFMKFSEGRDRSPKTLRVYAHSTDARQQEAAMHAESRLHADS